jgi:hypothetical protein
VRWGQTLHICKLGVTVGQTTLPLHKPYSKVESCLKRILKEQLKQFLQMRFDIFKDKH